jgi:hypothetical protein
VVVVVAGVVTVCVGIVVLLVVLVVVVVVLELLVVGVVVVVVLWAWQSFALSWLTVLAPCLRSLASVWLIVEGRSLTAFWNVVAVCAAAPQLPESIAVES